MRYRTDHPVLVCSEDSFQFECLPSQLRDVMKCIIMYSQYRFTKFTLNFVYYNVLHYTAQASNCMNYGRANECACLQTQAYLSLIHGVLTMLIQ